MIDIICKEALGNSGIYCILCLKTYKIYIGSSKDVYSRLMQHKSDLKYNRHRNKYLQNDWNEYGEVSFEYYVIQYCTKKELFEREQFYVDLYKAHYLFHGYNKAKITDTSYGYVFTEEQRKKVSEGLRKKQELDSSFIKRRTLTLKKVLNTPESKLKRSQITTESWNNPEIRQKRMEGIKNSDVSGRMKNICNKPEFKENQKINANLQWSKIENRQKMSEIKKEYYKNHPEAKQKHSEKMQIIMNTSEMKERVSKALKKFNQENPERVKEIKEKRLKTFALPEYKKRISNMRKELCKNPEYLQKMSKIQKDLCSSAEAKQRMRDISINFWNDKEKVKALALKKSGIAQEQVNQIEKLLEQKVRRIEIAKQVGCAPFCVGRVARKEYKAFYAEAV